MEIREITLDQYESALKDNGICCNFLQSPGYYKSRFHYGKDIHIYEGRQEEKPVFEVFIIYQRALKAFRLAYSPREWLYLKESNQDASQDLRDFVSSMKKMLRHQQCLVWKIESNVERLEHDANGNPMPEGFCNEDYRNVLKELGFEPGELWDGYDTSRQARWFSYIDLRGGCSEHCKGYPPKETELHKMPLKSMQELSKDWHTNVKRYCRLEQEPYIEVKVQNGQEPVDWDCFLDLLGQSAEKQGFDIGDPDRYKQYLESFRENGYMCTVWLKL